MEIPACLSIDLNNQWQQQRTETCKEPKMLLTSLSILNIKFEDEERWNIFAGEHNNIELKFIDFYVICEDDTFKIADDPDNKRYCNTKMPPESYYTKNSDISVIFKKSYDRNNKRIRRQGFRLKYTTIRHNLQNLTSSLEHTDRIGTSEFDAVDKVCSEETQKCYFVISTNSSMSWSEADFSCWQHNMTLVSIFSKNELYYIHYLLRDLRYRQPKKTTESNSLYLAHIGLVRSKEKHISFVWQNNAPLTFSAWSPGHPDKDLDCSVTNFKNFNSDNTWESQDCKKGLAKYFICERQITTEEVEFKRDDLCGVVSLTNHPDINITYSGKVCQHWSQHPPQMEHKDLYEPLVEHLNYCRDPLSFGMLWCYTFNKSQEPCFLQDK